MYLNIQAYFIFHHFVGKVLKSYIFISKESRERHLNSREFKQGQLRIAVEKTEMPVQGKDLAVLIGTVNALFKRPVHH